MERGEAESLLQAHAPWVLEEFVDAQLADRGRTAFLERAVRRVGRVSPAIDSELIIDAIQTLAGELRVIVRGYGERLRAGQICRDTAQAIRLHFSDCLREIDDTWPAPIAHEIEMLLRELGGEPPVLPSPEAALFQLRDVLEVLVKTPALVLSCALTSFGFAEDAQFVRAALFGNFHERIVGGKWLIFARNVSSRVTSRSNLAQFHDLARCFTYEHPLYRALAALQQARNDDIGHGSHRADPTETAAIVRHLLLGEEHPDAPRFRLPKLAPLQPALLAAAAAKPWNDLFLTAVDDERRIPLLGANAIVRWHADISNTAAGHHERELPIQLILKDGRTLELSPYIRARICTRCGHRDIFLFDTLYRQDGVGQFDLLDYGRGHKNRRNGWDVPDLAQELARHRATSQEVSEREQPQQPLAIPDVPTGRLSQATIIAHLDSARIDRNYIPPDYLRDRLAHFLSTKPRGIFWLCAPAHIGKTTFVQGLIDSSLDLPLFSPADPSAVVAAPFLCKKEYREGSASFLNGLADSIERALDLRRDLGEPKPDIKAVLSGDDRRSAFLTWLDSWRDLARAHHQLSTQPRLLIIIDGLDETDPPAQSNSLLNLLPESNNIPNGLYFLLTSRRPPDPDSPSWLAAAVEPLLEDLRFSETNRVDLNDPAYQSLLHAYIAKRLAGALDDVELQTLSSVIIERSRDRFSFVSFLVTRLIEFGIDPAAEQAIVGDELFRHFLATLNEEFGVKRSAIISDLLAFLAAEEKAHDWLFSQGATPDRVQPGSILEPYAREWRGVPFDFLAQVLDFDAQPVVGLSHQTDPRLMDALIAIQGALSIFRVDFGPARYRIGLKGFADIIAAEPSFADRICQSHQRIVAAAAEALTAAAVPGELSTAVLTRISRIVARLPGHLAVLEHVTGTVPMDLATAFVALNRAVNDCEASRMVEFGISILNTTLILLERWGSRQFETAELAGRILTCYLQRANLKKNHAPMGYHQAQDELDIIIDYFDFLGAQFPTLPFNDNRWSHEVLVYALTCRAELAVRYHAFSLLPALKDVNRAIIAGESYRQRHPLDVDENKVSAFDATILPVAYSIRGQIKRRLLSCHWRDALDDFDRALLLLQPFDRGGRAEIQTVSVSIMIERTNLLLDCGYPFQGEDIEDLDAIVDFLRSCRQTVGDICLATGEDTSSILVNAFMTRSQFRSRCGDADRAFADCNEAIDVFTSLSQDLTDAVWRNSIDFQVRLRRALLQRGALHLAAGRAEAAVPDFDTIINEWNREVQAGKKMSGDLLICTGQAYLQKAKALYAGGRLSGAELEKLVLDLDKFEETTAQSENLDLIHPGVQVYRLLSSVEVLDDKYRRRLEQERTGLQTAPKVPFLRNAVHFAKSDADAEFRVSGFIGSEHLEVPGGPDMAYDVTTFEDSQLQKVTFDHMSTILKDCIVGPQTKLKSLVEHASLEWTRVASVYETAMVLSQCESKRARYAAHQRLCGVIDAAREFILRRVPFDVNDRYREPCFQLLYDAHSALCEFEILHGVFETADGIIHYSLGNAARIAIGTLLVEALGKNYRRSSVWIRLDLARAYTLRAINNRKGEMRYSYTSNEPGPISETLLAFAVDELAAIRGQIGEEEWRSRPWLMNLFADAYLAREFARVSHIVESDKWKDNDANQEAAETAAQPENRVADLERRGTELRNLPLPHSFAIRSEIALVHSQLGLAKWGENPQHAVDGLTGSINLAEELLVEFHQAEIGTPIELRRDLAQYCASRAQVRWDVDAFETAVDDCTQACELLKGVQIEFREEFDMRPFEVGMALVRTYALRGRIKGDASSFSAEDAIADLRLAIAEFEKMQQSRDLSAYKELQAELARIYQGCGQIAHTRGLNVREAIADFDSALVALESSREFDMYYTTPEHWRVEGAVAEDFFQVYVGRAEARSSADEHALAEEDIDRALEVLEEIHTVSGHGWQLQGQFIWALRTRASARWAQGKRAGAIHDVNAAVAHLESSAELRDVASTEFVDHDLADLLVWMANAEAQDGEHRAAIDLLSSAIRLWENLRSLAGHNWAVESQFNLANAYWSRAVEQEAIEDWRLAIDNFTRAIALREDVKAKSPDAWSPVHEEKLAVAYACRAMTRERFDRSELTAGLLDCEHAITLMEQLRHDAPQSTWEPEWEQHLAEMYGVRDAIQAKKVCT
jgi:tetratricopeptide (TPR) repeat protein